MDTKKMRLAVLSIVAITMLSSSTALAADNNSGVGQDNGAAEAKWAEKRHELYKDLNLNEDQKKALEANKARYREGKKSLFARMSAARTFLAQELQREKLDMGKITQANNDLKKLEAQSLDQRLASILEVRKILTQEQFKKMMSRMEDRRGHFKHKGHE